MEVMFNHPFNAEMFRRLMDTGVEIARREMEATIQHLKEIDHR